MSGREVLLQVWVEEGNLDRSAHAMDSPGACNEWDEATFGLELDLDRFMIVAVSDFNMGAMENKGLNIFNAKYVLAIPARRPTRTTSTSSPSSPTSTSTTGPATG
jgi:aminopeptidase N